MGMKVWVNGTFDVLHIGHLKMLEYAKSLGKLVVGIDSDKRVKELKGCNRPFNNEQSRKYFLLSLKFVDEVVIFDSSEELIECVKNYEPDYMVIGDDYRNKVVYGCEFAKELVYYEKIPNCSTTNILRYENSSDR